MAGSCKRGNTDVVDERSNTEATFRTGQERGKKREFEVGQVFVDDSTDWVSYHMF